MERKIHLREIYKKITVEKIESRRRKWGQHLLALKTCEHDMTFDVNDLRCTTDLRRQVSHTNNK